MRHRSASGHFPLFILHACALAASLAAGAAQAADEQVAAAWTFGGFGSIGVAHSDYDKADFVASNLKGNGAGYTHAWSPDLDSRLGAQLGLKANKQWSAVVQVISEQRFNGSYKPVVEWANVKYQATPDLSLRVGRIALPIFLAADYRKVGYAYPSVRVPIEVYSGVPISNSDGADVSYRWQSGGVKHVTQAFYGNTHINLTPTSNASAHNIVGVTHTIEYGALTLRANVVTAVFNTDILRPLFDGFRQFGPQGAAIADKYDILDKRIDVQSIGINYDPGKWFVMAEGGTSNGHSFIGKSRGMFISAGYRVGEFTPYATYSRNDAQSPVSDPGLSTAGLPPAYAYAAMQLNDGLDQTLKTRSSQTSTIAGVRWDFHTNMAFKLQYERVLPRNGSRGTLANLQPGFVSGHAVHVTSALLDFVF